MITFSAAAYSLGDAVFASADPPLALVELAGRANLALACVHCAAWMVYVRRQYGDPVGRPERYAIGVLGVIALIGLVPGWAMGSVLTVQRVEWAGVTYHVPEPTPVGLVFMLLVPWSLGMPALTYARKARLRTPGARVHVVASRSSF